MWLPYSLPPCHAMARRKYGATREKEENPKNLVPINADHSFYFKSTMLGTTETLRFNIIPNTH